MPPVSVLDLAPVPQGSTPAEALRNALDLARHAERWGYMRYWLAEHHNMACLRSRRRRPTHIENCGLGALSQSRRG